jgi:hypothetical protein
VHRDWIRELLGVIDERYAALCRVEPRVAAFSRPDFSPALQEDEAEGFVRGLEEALFSVRDTGHFSSPMLPRPEKPQDQKTLNLFDTKNQASGERHLSREKLCQMAAAADLALRYDWPSSQIFIEPSNAVISGLACAVDIVVSDSTGRRIIFGEVKKCARLVEELVRDVRDCGHRGPHEMDACGSDQHKKFEALWKCRPEYFWAVGPGTRRAFRLRYAPSSIALDEPADVPRGS